MGSDQLIRLAVLTSSRADFGIYIPLLNLIKSDLSFNFEIIAFGAHLSNQFGYTISEINESGFIVSHSIESLLASDSPGAISSSFGLTYLKFADFWRLNTSNYDFVLCLGDRFEMAAAVMAGIPFGVRFIHLYGGETTLGAIDNIYRHCITLSSQIHLVSTETFKNRIKELMGDVSNCFVVGSLSLDSFEKLRLLTKEEFYIKWGIDLNLSTILVTVHPETIDFRSNEPFANEISTALESLARENQIVVTLPNADTNGNIFRKKFIELKNRFPDKFHLIESFGKISYFTCMKYADHLLGNTSSGIVEAASFQKFVINIGNRQKGRLAGENVIHVPFQSDEILKASAKARGKRFEGSNIYYKYNSASTIVSIVRQKHVEL